MCLAPTKSTNCHYSTAALKLCCTLGGSIRVKLLSPYSANLSVFKVQRCRHSKYDARRSSTENSLFPQNTMSKPHPKHSIETFHS